MAEQKRPRRSLDSDSDEEGGSSARHHDSDGDDEDEEQDEGASAAAAAAATAPAAGSDAAAAFMQRSQAAQQQQQPGRRSRNGSGRPRRADAQEDSEDSGEDIMENLESDYRAIPELDRYDEELLDDAEQDELDIEERQRVERLLAERDEKEGRARMRTRVPLALDSSSDDEADVLEQQRRLRIQESAALGGRIAAPAEGEDIEPLDLDTFANTPLSEWIYLEGPRGEIMRQFSVFLNTFSDDDGYGDADDEDDENDRSEAPFYREKIIQMCTANRQSLHVSYVHLSRASANMAIWLADEPHEMLELFNAAAQSEVIKLFPNYGDTHQRILVRVTDLPVHDNLRELREVHLNALIKVSGVVTRRTGVFPQLTVAFYNCKACGYLVGPKPVKGREEPRIGSCPECQSPGPFLVNHEKTIFRNYQRVTIQESPGSVPAGRVPRRKECVLTDDLIDAARPGQEVEITGIYTHSFDAALNTRQGFPVFATIIVANYIRSKEDVFSTTLLTKEDKEQIMELSQDPKIGARIINSIAPSIYGMDHVKTAIALSLFGGREKMSEKHRIRGDINVLLLGDPGVAKSQFLKYVQKTAPRAIYTTGKGASAVGLTAGVHLDPITKEWTLEGGALVLADRGVCMIDEFDKMNDQDRTSIHEAMEQQSISISKAGLVTTLQARCAVLAAANPIGGRYDISRTLAQNVTLTDPILQRFDILCVCLDSVDPVSDERLARFVTSSHMASHPARSAAARRISSQDPWGLEQDASAETKGNRPSPGEKRKAHNLDSPDQSDAGMARTPADDDAEEDDNGYGEKLSQDLLRKYLIYARTHCRPQLHDINQDKLARLYADLRKASAEVGGVPIAVRHIESILRMAEAHARMHLRDFVREDDVDMAIKVMLDSFIGAQKFSVKSVLQKRFKRYLWHGKNNNAILSHLLETLVRDQQRSDQLFGRLSNGDDDDLADLSSSTRVRLDQLQMLARENEVYDVSNFLKSADFRRDYSVADDGNGNTLIVKTF